MHDPRFQMAWGNTALTLDERSALTTLLSPRERQRASHLSPARAQRYLAGRVLARKLAAEVLGVAWESVIPQARCTECDMDHGPITIADTDLFLSLAYSRNEMVALCAQGVRCGVDLEHGDPADERVVPTSVGTHSVTLQQWCDYEAVAKADGRGIHLDMADIHVAQTTHGHIVTVEQSPYSYTLLRLDAPMGMVLSAALHIPGD